MSFKFRKAWRMRASAPSTNLLLAGSTPCMPATKMKSPARAPTLHVSFPVLIAPDGLSVLTPLGEGDWAKLSVVVQANTRPQETKQRANMAKPLPHMGLCIQPTLRLRATAGSRLALIWGGIPASSDAEE